ncbi:Phosphate-binding protein PstS precursor [Rhodobacteraceae bacterium THAF1]|uniref:PstS family phosphate ABC transporter substrate-binding protein n=1 Tax=Palleronia sp. THAF1 TaxID=2587842 RepID=UPI000F3CA762|nr:substrate-binding domain-containing protein [Palleronia sp. THAF1]QFU08436.1 Phosphate-binding protein PstS precursor [Palleronia sp. THAF1]VDC29285.1 Phosphate-binding protein PstS precursor [Rhodobacteraceae bacterium THAF1]
MSFAKTTASFAILAAAATAASAQGREQVQVAGSSTVLPYANIVAEAFGESTEFPTPVIQSGGSSAGLKLFCEGVGENTIDIANASRAIRDSEIETCAANGVNDIIEVRIGYDGIVFASQTDGPEFSAFEPEQWYNALAAEIPMDGEMVANPNTNWTDVDDSLPDAEILAFIPGTKHGTREVFEEKVLLQGCEDSGAMETMMSDMGMDEDAAEAACMSVRTDGASVDIDGDYTETLARIESDPNGVGVFGLSFYENNTSVLKVATMGGVSPSTETIASGEYPVSRPLYFYIKKAHIGVIPGVKEYAAFFVSDQVAGQGGPLADYGLTPDPELAATQEKIANETTMSSGS